jgi:DNA-binding beta-propeller fold protein YncE
MTLLNARAARAGLMVALLVGIGCEDAPDLMNPNLPLDPAPSACPRSPGNICTVAGTGIPGDGADLLPPLQTRLYAPVDMTFSPSGRLVVVDWNNHRIRATNDQGLMRIVAGVGELAPEALNDDVGTRLNHPTDVIFDAQGRMVIAAWHNSRVKRVDMNTLELEDIAGTGARSYGGDGGPAMKCDLNLPAGVVYDPAGNLLVSDQANQRIRLIDPQGIISTIAGSGKRGFAGDGGPALLAEFALPVGQRGHPAAHIVLAPDGTLYLADTENNRIRAITPGPERMVTTVAGNGKYGWAGDGGPAVGAELAYPVDVAIGPDNVLYIADTENNCVRKVQDGVISTVAGVCGGCGSALDDACRCPLTDTACIGDGRPATSARLKRPTGIAFDKDGNLYIADTLNHRVRVVYR